MQEIFKGVPFFGNGNSLFPDTIIIDESEKRVTYYKRSLNILGYTAQSMYFRDVSSVILYHRVQYLMFSAVIIESSGGLHSIEAKGFLPNDAKEIKRILTGLKARHF